LLGITDNLDSNRRGTRGAHIKLCGGGSGKIDNARPGSGYAPRYGNDHLPSVRRVGYPELGTHGQTGVGSHKLIRVQFMCRPANLAEASETGALRGSQINQKQPDE
jgi:hypothetical protein